MTIRDPTVNILYFYMYVVITAPRGCNTVSIFPGRLQRILLKKYPGLDNKSCH